MFLKMSIIQIILIGVALSMDAFAVSVSKGLTVGKPKIKHYFIIGAWFGGFQALMPLAGYFLGKSFEKYITNVDHWIAFFLLAFLGGKMIKESLQKKDDESEMTDSFAFGTMLLMALATSIDALAVGITFSFETVDIWLAISVIGVTTFVFSAVGLKIGSVVGDKFNKKAEIAGGIILILIGLKILLEHLGVITLPF